ncbi:DNA-binding response regulator [Novosphingobium sp. PC22D]|uniref:response regulator transcription factor n=1 Tax=Novosphingobium sp. PC22D TaxID=1962403 RepID=UPI000BF053A7|nr:response regulator [Novosphingobium sp. PC22D]PEQ13800.1 DNA-binding response regulator [Novosphingobium sp. PC22D]
MTDGTGRSRLVHVIDDEDSVRRSLEFLLRSEGYRVERLSDGESFLGNADKSAHACLLLDIRMPGLDGLEVQERMAAAGLDFPVIVLTGHGDIDLAVRAMKAGAVDFLVKPFDREKLLDSLARGFRKIDDREALRERADWARAQLGKLTEREREVLDGLACGYPNKTIAYDLGISSRTVEVYRANVMAKLQVAYFADALRIAFAAGMGSESRWRAAHDPGPPPS